MEAFNSIVTLLDDKVWFILNLTFFSENVKIL